jgi:DNA-directed RNA polymerase specialized sigma24 family protein
MTHTRHRVAKALPHARPRNAKQLWQVIVGHQELIGRACVQRLGDVPEAEDAQHDVVLRAVSEGPQHHEVQRLAALARQEVDRRRWWEEHHGDEPAGLLPNPDGLDPGEAALLRIAIADGLRKLSKAERDAVAVAFAGYSLSEAAWRLGIGINAFKGRLRSAREHLRALGLGLGAGLAALLRRLRARRRGGRTNGAFALRVALDRYVGSAVASDVTTQTLVPAALALLLLVGAASPTPAGSLAAPAHHGVADLPARVPLVSAVNAPAVPRRGGPLQLEVRRQPVGTVYLTDLSGADTIADTQLTAATADPDFDSTHTALGLGTGASCGCPLLYRTTDGGRTWEHTPPGVVPPVLIGATIALPPTYPTDPRIFIGNPAQPGLLDYVAPVFGGPFAALPLPPGQLAVSAGLDNGDPRVFDATSAGVLSYRFDTGQTDVVVGERPAGSSAPALLATPFGDTASAVVVLTAITSLIPPATPVPGPTLLICPRNGPCQARVGQNLPSGAFVALALSPSFLSDGGVMVATTVEAAISLDAGRSFHPLPAPPTGTYIHSAAITSSRAWAIAERGDGQDALMLSANFADRAWVDVTSRDPKLGLPGLLLAPSAGRVLDIVVGVAVRCTVDGGVSWHARCQT